MLNNKFFLSLSLLMVSGSVFGMDLSIDPKSPGALFEASLTEISADQILANKKTFWTSSAKAFISGRRFPGVSFLLNDRTHDNLLLHNCLLYCDTNLLRDLYSFMKTRAIELNCVDKFIEYIKMQDSNGLNALHCAASRVDVKLDLIKDLLSMDQELAKAKTAAGDIAYSIYSRYGSELCDVEIIALLNPESYPDIVVVGAVGQVDNVSAKGYCVIS